MAITVPQMFMITHAINVNHERSQRKYKRTAGQPVEEEEEVPTYNGKPLSECTSQEMKLYYGGFFGG